MQTERVATDVCEDRQADNNTAELLFTESKPFTSAFPLPLPCPSPSVYLGHHTFLINPYDLETNPALWMSTISQYKGGRNQEKYGR